MPTEHEILRAIWLKAFRDGLVSIRYPDQALVFKMRMRLYSIIKPLRKKPSADPQLWEAYSNCEACVEAPAGQPATLTIRRTSESPLLQAALDQLNLEIEEFSPPKPEPTLALEPEPEPEESSFLKRLQEDSPES